MTIKIPNTGTACGRSITAPGQAFERKHFEPPAPVKQSESDPVADIPTIDVVQTWLTVLVQEKNAELDALLKNVNTDRVPKYIGDEIRRCRTELNRLERQLNADLRYLQDDFQDRFEEIKTDLEVEGKL